MSRAGRGSLGQDGPPSRIAQCGSRRDGAMATRITREVLEGYLNCKTEASLKLDGQ